MTTVGWAVTLIGVALAVISILVSIHLARPGGISRWLAKATRATVSFTAMMAAGPGTLVVLPLAAAEFLFDSGTPRTGTAGGLWVACLLALPPLALLLARALDPDMGRGEAATSQGDRAVLVASLLWLSICLALGGYFHAIESPPLPDDSDPTDVPGWSVLSFMGAAVAVLAAAIARLDWESQDAKTRRQLGPDSR